MGVISPVSLSPVQMSKPTTVQQTGLKFNGDRVGEGVGQVGVGCALPSRDLFL